jgi:hypothetical protein
MADGGRPPALIRLEIARREPFADGHAFGERGAYEKLVGTARFAVDPERAPYGAIVDIDRAPRNDEGLVEFESEVAILKPLQVAAGNGRLLFDVVNRGNKRIVQFFNDAPASNDPSSLAQAGNGFLMRQGYTVVWAGWQGDLLPVGGQMTMRLPVATERGRPITGLVRTEFIADAPGIASFPLSGNAYTRSYPAAAPDPARARFTVREREGDPRTPIPAGRWQFARAERDAGGGARPVPSATDCYLGEGFRPGWIYELVYEARDPLVLGLGFVAVRDLVAYLRHRAEDADGRLNPLWEPGGAIRKAYAWGRSQSGRFLREFVYRGFNEDDRGGRVFDAVWAHVAGAGRVWLNHRFGDPGRYSRQHEEHLFPSDRFPFAYAEATDLVTGKADAILKRPATDPLVVHTQTSSEYWQRRGSLAHTDARGNDLPVPPTVRIYAFASSQHFCAPGEAPARGICQHLSNPLQTTPLLRALLVALDRWATEGIPPPPSRIPTRAAGTLVPADVGLATFPKIPGAACPSGPNDLVATDYGPEFEAGRMPRQPPEPDPTKPIAVLVPAVDADGNDLAGIRTPEVEAPLATHTGWNVRAAGFVPGALASITGSWFPFARTGAERARTGDPRPAVEERYPTRAAYVRAVARACERLLGDRLLLPEDADRYVAAAMRLDPLGSGDLRLTFCE